MSVEVLAYLRRAAEHDAKILADTAIPPSDWGWRSKRSVVVAAKRAGIPDRGAVIDCLRASVDYNVVDVRASSRQSGNEYRIR